MKNNTSFAMRVKKDFKRNKFKYFLIAPVIVYFILFAYKPMYGVVVAFQKYRLTAGISGSPWVGFYQFERFFSDPYFFRLLRNTFSMRVWSRTIEFIEIRGYSFLAVAVNSASLS